MERVRGRTFRECRLPLFPYWQFHDGRQTGSGVQWAHICDGRGTALRRNTNKGTKTTERASREEALLCPSALGHTLSVLLI